MIKFKKDREGFSMIMAIVLILSMAMVALLVSNITGKMSKETATQYQREESILLAKSYTEYAIMAVSANDRTTGNCIDTINGTIGTPLNGLGFRIVTNITYIGDGGVSGCSRVLSDSVVNLKSKLNIIIDVYVSYKEIQHSKVSSAPWMTYHKRSLQKI